MDKKATKMVLKVWPRAQLSLKLKHNFSGQSVASLIEDPSREKRRKLGGELKPVPTTWPTKGVSGLSRSLPIGNRLRLDVENYSLRRLVKLPKPRDEGLTRLLRKRRRKLKRRKMKLPKKRQKKPRRRQKRPRDPQQRRREKLRSRGRNKKDKREERHYSVVRRPLRPKETQQKLSRHVDWRSFVRESLLSKPKRKRQWRGRKVKHC